MSELELDLESEGKMSKLGRLDEGTSRTIRRGQMITKISDVVRELIDNAVDARCTRIQVLLENFGIKQIEVRDDGHGIPAEQFRQAISGGHTSKLPSDELLSCNEHYGFRGEALSSICSFATVDILTKTSNDRYGIRYHLDVDGRVVSQSPGPISKGTHVKVSDLFAKYPVRRIYIQEKNRSANELKEIQSYMKSVALANPSIQFGLIHNRSTLWTKPAVVNLDQAIIPVFGILVAKDLYKCGPIAFSTSGAGRKSSGTLSTIELFTPRAPVDIKLMTQTTNKLTMIFVNRRRVYVQEFEKLIRAYTQAATDSESSSGTTRFPTCVLKIQVPPDQVDFNREIDKSHIWLPCQNEIAEKLNEMLHEYYKVDINNENQPRAKRLKTSTSDKMTVPNNNVPLSVRNDNINPVRTNTEQADRIVPNYDSPVSSTKKRTENAKSFLANIPVTSTANFRQSSTKAPGFTKPIISSREPRTAQAKVITDVSLFDCPSNRIQFELPRTPPPTPRSFGTRAVPDMNSDTNRSSHILETSMERRPSGTGTVVAPPVPIDEEWIHGRLRDKHGNIIESTTVFTGGMAMSTVGSSKLKKRSKSPEFRTVPTTPKPTLLRESNFYTPESSRDKYQSFMSKIATCHSGSSGTPVCQANPIRRPGRPARTPLFNQTPIQEVVAGGRGSQKFPKQVTLDRLRNWKMSGASFEKTNSVRTSTISPDVIGAPKSLSTFNGSDAQESFPPEVPESVRGYLEAISTQRKKLFELKQSVPAKEVLLPKPVQSQSTEVPPEETEPKTRVIAPLSSSTYIVAIGKMLGAFSPSNLLEMEPSFKVIFGISPTMNDPEKYDLSMECVESLLQEFTGLEQEDYSEDQARRVFHLLCNL